MESAKKPEVARQSTRSRKKSPKQQLSEENEAERAAGRIEKVHLIAGGIVAFVESHLDGNLLAC